MQTVMGILSSSLKSLVFHISTSFDAPQSSGAREFHPHALTDPYVRLSPHTALIIQPTINGLPRPTDSSHCWLINQPKQDDLTPSLHPHYRDFIATMG